MIFRQTEIKPLWYFLLSVEWYRCQLRQPGVCGSLNQGPGTTWWCIHKAADKQRAMARQGHVFCPEIGHLCLFAQREKKTQSWKWFRVVLIVCLIWETAARSRAALCTLFYCDINQRWGVGVINVRFVAVRRVKWIKVGGHGEAQIPTETDCESIKQQPERLLSP